MSSSTSPREPGRGADTGTPRRARGHRQDPGHPAEAGAGGRQGPPTRLILIRHGESRWNVERRVQGQSGAGLSPRGRAQAEVTSAFVAAREPGAALYTSDLERCTQTAAPLARALGRRAVPDPALRERDFGAWTGRLAADIARDDPGRWGRWRGGEDVLREVGGESTVDLEDRVARVLRRLAAAAGPGGVVVCVTHGGPTWHGTRALVGLPDGALGGVDNASVTEIARGGEGAYLRAFNQTAHLPPDLVGDTHRPSEEVRARARVSRPGSRAGCPPGT